MAALPSNIGVRTPRWILSYAGKNITADISSAVVEISFVDHEGHVGNEIEVRVADEHRRFQGPWYPATGDLLNLQIGYAGETLAPCGDFNIDELELDFPPDVMHIRALAATITSPWRTPIAQGYENQTLTQIASTIAAKHGYSVVGLPNAINVTFQRVTQNRETDLAFLKRIAREHNYDFKIDTQSGASGTHRVLVFYSIPALEAQAPIRTFTRADIMRGHLKARTHRVYASAVASYQNPATKSLVTQSASASSAPTPDTLKVATRIETAPQAALKAQAALHRHNMMQTTGHLTMPGDAAMLAGVVITLSGFGAYSGNYLVSKATHRLERSSGYTTELEVRNVIAT